MLKEIEAYRPVFDKETLDSIYFGGGTPSLFGPENLCKVLESLPNRNAEAEITLEANPDQLTKEKLRSFRKIGINRLSIGVQSFDDRLLQTLTRTHDADRAAEAVLLAKEEGIHNISIDLMFDLPGQKLDQWKASLNQAISLPVTHLSLYNLTIEPQTLFYRDRDRLSLQMPDEEVSTKMYISAQEIAKEGGFQQYEISAFCREGLASRHNKGYWTGDPFLGIGPSAYSFLGGKRFKNISHLGKYSERLHKGESPVDFSEKLSPVHAKRELLAVRLRLLEGIELLAFEKKWGKLDQETWKTLDRLTEEGLLHDLNGKKALTRQGVLHYDTVAQELI